jgi:gluconolactonase
MEWKFDLVAGPYDGPLYGPVWDGQSLLFSVISKDMILAYDPSSGEVNEFRRYMAGIKGMAFDTQGNLYGCQSSARRIVRFNRDGSTSLMEEQIVGKFHNQPYGLTVDGQGRIWFSDPIDSAPTRGPQLQPPLEHQSVLRLEPRAERSSQIKRMTHDTQSPGAILLSRDQQTLYLAENSQATNGKRELRAYPIDDDGTLGFHTVLHTFGADHRGVHRGIAGMCLDRESNIIACAGWHKSGPGPMVCIFAPSGRVLETHPVPADEPLMCTFGNSDLGTLYVTTRGGHLYGVRNTGRQGWVLYPRSSQ